jgi:iron complex outermembrane receptor protein
MKSESLNRSVRIALACAGTATAFIWSNQTALAQSAQANTQSAEASAAGDQLQEVIVTAEKRTENLQSIPFAVAAVSGETFDNLHYTDFRDLTGSIPNVNFTQISNVALDAALTIRGMGIPNNPDPYTGTEVAIVIDGVVQGTRLLGLADQFDVDRIEVLRGPQGELFGANTLGGVINVVTKQPTDELEAYGRLTAGNFHELDAAGALNFPILDDGVLSGKVSVSKDTRDGFFTNLYDGQNLEWINTTTGRASLLFKPTDDFKATLTYTAQIIRNGADVVPNRSYPGESFYVPGVSGVIDFNIYSNVTEPNNANTNSLTLTMNWDSPFLGKVTSISNYSNLNAYNVQDVSALDDIFGLNAVRTLGSWQLSEEVRSNFKPIQSVDVLVGLFAMKVDHDIDTYTMVPGLAPGIATDQLVTGADTSLAAFEQTYWSITDKLRLGFGARVSHIDVDLSSQNATFYNANLSPTDIAADKANATNLGGGFIASGGKTWTEPSGKVGLDYTFTPDLMAYGYAARGFKEGGFNGRITIPQDIGPYNPEWVKSYEVGLKSDWLDHRLRVNADVFYNSWTNMQVAESIYINNEASSTILNAASAVTKGAELELTVIPVSGLTLSANMGYLDAYYEDFTSGTVSYAGRPTPYAPKWTASGSAHYAIRTGPGTTTLTAQYEYTGQRWGNYTEATSEYLNSVGLLNANIGWAPTHGKWDIALWGKNITNKYYYSSALDVPPSFTIASYGAPRQFGVDINYHL